MSYKVCKGCGRTLPISDYYKHPQMGDGYLNYCKECVKERVRNKYMDNTKDEDFVEKERKRGREKYQRLGYAQKRTLANQLKRKKYPGLRGGRRAFKDEYPQTVELHHWNYNRLDQVIVLDKRLHKRVHAIMVFDLDLGYYFHNGEPLDTISKHLEVIRGVCERDGFDFSEVKVLSK